MATKKPLVIVTRKLPEAIETRMMELFNTRLNEDDRPMSQADLIDASSVVAPPIPGTPELLFVLTLTSEGQ